MPVKPVDFESMPTKEFREFATSWAGCRGGAPNAKYWFCGIEYGTAAFAKHEKKIREPIKQLTPVDNALSTLNHEFGTRMLKLLFSIHGDWNGFGGKNRIRELTRIHQPLGKKGFACRFNLYPLAFRTLSHALWSKEVSEEVGLPTKDLYKAWCQLFRFPMFRRILLEGDNRPDLILCSGKNQTSDFFHAFSGINNLSRSMRRLEEAKVSEQTVQWAPISIGQGHKIPMVVIPFLNHWALGSDKDIHAVGKWISDNLLVK